MKHMTLLLAALLFLVMNIKAQTNPVNGEILADSTNLTIIKVWGTAEERGYAYGFLINQGIKDISEGFIQPNFGEGYDSARTLISNGTTFSIDSLFLVEAMAVVDGMADAGVDTSEFDYIDLLLINFFFDFSHFDLSALSFGCSTFMSWGDATEGTDLNGGSVISRHYDHGYVQVLVDNMVISIHLPTEENTQPWLNVEGAGVITPSGGGVNQQGISVYQNTMNCDGIPDLNAGYEPFEYTMRKAIESADYNGDGVNNTQDVRDAINSNPQGYAGTYIISTIAKYDPTSDSLTALIAEIAPEEPVITFRTNTYNDTIPGDNLYAANQDIARNNARQYCSRYLNMVDHMGDGTGIGSEENWALMRDYSHQPLSFGYFIQHIPGWNQLKVSYARDGEHSAWELEPIILDLRELFNRTPDFTSNPDTIAFLNTEYIYYITVSDPDPMDTITISAETIPDWLTLEDNGDGTAQLAGVPPETGVYEVILITSDGMAADTQSFTIDAMPVSIHEINHIHVKIYPVPFKDKICIECEAEMELSVFSSSGILLSNYTLNAQKNIIDLSTLPAGLYYARVTAGKESAGLKLIKK